MAKVNYSYYTLDDAEMTKQANKILELIERRAYEDGLLDDYKALSKKYSIVLAKKGTLTRWFEKMFMPDAEEGTAAFVILMNPPVNEEEIINE